MIEGGHPTSSAIAGEHPAGVCGRSGPTPGGARRGRPDAAQTSAQAYERHDGDPPSRVAVANDSHLPCEAIGQVLEREPGVDVVAVCSDGDELMAAVEEHRPRVVVVDIRMPPSGDDEAILMAAIEAVADSGSVAHAKVVESLIAARVHAERSPLTELTQREREILSHIAQGKSNQAIADTLFLTKRAVEKHINTIFMTLGLTNAEELSRRVKAALIYLADQPR